MGVRLRTQENHGKTRFVLDWDNVNGKRKQKFFPSAEDRADYMDRNGITEHAGKGITVDQILGTWLTQTATDRQENSQRAAKYRANKLLSILTELGVTRISQITPGTFSQVVTKLEEEELAYPTIHTYASAYKAVMKWAIRHNYMRDDQLGDCKLREPHENRIRYLTKEEISTLLDFVPESRHPWMETPVALGIYQGLRRLEVCRLKNKDVNLQNSTLTVGRSKNKKIRTIQLHPQMDNYLPATIPDTDEHLCRNGSGNRLRGEWVTHAFGHIRNQLASQDGSWKDVSFHTLRHTCASQMALSGNFTLNEMALFLGHSNIETTRKYVHLMPGQVTPNW